MQVVDFYDGFAADYHLVYGDDWESAVERHGEALARLIRGLRPEALDVLDCSCGIGTQAIGLARRGYRVHGTDLSPRRRARPGRGGAARRRGFVRRRRDGLLLVSTRDYDEALATRPATMPPRLVEGPPRRLVARLHDWDGPESPLHTVWLFVLTETDAGWSLEQHSVRYRAITRAALARLAEAAGLQDVVWLEPDATGLGQPLLAARR